jgi:hypothetical protein
MKEKPTSPATYLDPKGSLTIPGALFAFAAIEPLIPSRLM